MPNTLSPTSQELPEEIATAIEELMRQSRGWYCAPEAHEVVQAREALTAAILSRLGEAEARREEAERKWAEANALLTKILAQPRGDH